MKKGILLFGVIICMFCANHVSAQSRYSSNFNYDTWALEWKFSYISPPKNDFIESAWGMGMDLGAAYYITSCIFTGFGAGVNMNNYYYKGMDENMSTAAVNVPITIGVNFNAFSFPLSVRTGPVLSFDVYAALEDGLDKEKIVIEKPFNPKWLMSADLDLFGVRIGIDYMAGLKENSEDYIGFHLGFMAFKH